MSKGTTSKLIKLGVMMSFFAGIYFVTGISDYLYDNNKNMALNPLISNQVNQTTQKRPSTSDDSVQLNRPFKNVANDKSALTKTTLKSSL